MTFDFDRSILDYGDLAAWAWLQISFDGDWFSPTAVVPGPLDSQVTLVYACESLEEQGWRSLTDSSPSILWDGGGVVPAGESGTLSS